jgi:hypothetical protein
MTPTTINAGEVVSTCPLYTQSIHAFTTQSFYTMSCLSVSIVKFHGP